MKKSAICLIALLTGVTHCLFAQNAKLPFPPNSTYTETSVMPKNHSRAELNNSAVHFYNIWKQTYIRHDCSDTSQYYVLNNEGNVNGKTPTICVSEGQGYGMQIMALMAGYEKYARTIFDGMFKFARVHPSNKSPYLMAGNIYKNCELHKNKGFNSSATNGDFDIALALLMADNQWGSNGEINYRAEALKNIEAIIKHEINSKYHTILLSANNVLGDFDFYDIRSSDFMPAHLRVFNAFYPNAEWLKVIDNNYMVLENMRNTYSPKAGLLPDFIAFDKGKYTPSKPNYLESKHDGEYYYNACRVPYRVAVDYLIFGDERAKNLLTPLNNWIQESTLNNADQICAGYHLNGEPIAGANIAVPAFVCPFAVGAIVNIENQIWVNDCWDFIADFEFNDYQSLDNTIQMLSLLVLSGNYWLPQC